MIKEEPIDLSIIDGKEIKKIQEKQKKIQRVMEIIRENNLDKDKDFMEEIEELIEALKEEK
jgi:hypothetical protein